MKYTKPVVLAQNKKSGSFAATCPANMNGKDWRCRNCERTR